MRAVLYLDPGIVEFVEATAPGEYGLLLGVGPLLISARAGHLSGIGVGENPNVTVSLDDTDKRLEQIINHPLRKRMDVFYDNADEYFSGTVASIKLGLTWALTLES